MKKIFTILLFFIVSVCGLAQTVNSGAITSTENKVGKGGTGDITGETMLNYFTNIEEMTAFGLNVGMGYRYYIHDNFYAEGLLGYRFIESLSSSPDDIENTEHDITIPIHAGVFFPMSEKFGFELLAGPRFDIPVAYKSEVNNEKVKTEKPDAHTAFELGCGLRFTDWGIRAIYGIGLGEMNKANYIAVAASYGF